MRALVRRPWPSVRTSSSTSPCQSRTSRSTSGREPRRRLGEVGVRVPASGCPPGRRRQARAVSDAAVSALESSSAATPLCSASPEALGRRRVALDGGGELVAPARDRRLDLPEELAGADELLPAGEHLAAQQGAVGHARRRPDGAPRRTTRRPPRRSDDGGVVLVAAGDDELGGAPDSESTAPRRVCPTTIERARASLASACSHERSRSTASARQPAVGVERRLGHGEDRRRRQPLLAQHRGEVRADLGDGIRRDAVEHDRDGGAAVGGGAQQVPGHGIRVARRGGDEEPQVGGGEQLGGDGAVGGDDRVDVGGVEQRHARRAARWTRRAARCRAGSRRCPGR